MKTIELSSTALAEANYRHLRRVVFLFSALSTRSSLALPLLAKINTKRAKLDSLWIQTNQARTETELAAALAAYREWPIRKLRSMDRINLAMLAIRLGESELAQSVLKGMGSVFDAFRWCLPKTVAALTYQSINEGMNASFAINRDYSVELGFLKLDVTNPFRSAAKPTDAASNAWVERLGKQLFARGTGTLQLADTPGSPFDRLSVVNLPKNKLNANPTEPKPLVTVVVSTFQPGQHLLVAVQSVLAQTYPNLEILVIDDASGSKYDSVLAQVAALDSRVKVLRQETNGGTYRIRNRALDESTGEFITFHDSDDWMHPLRVQLQVEHLLKHKNLMSNISASTRITDNLEGVESNRHLRIGLCEPALMFRREPVKAKIGYFDSVRKGGDVEYRRRIDRAFGQRTVVIHPWFNLTLQRTDNGGLTEGELGYRWIAPYRTLHRDAYVLWQRKAASAGNLRIEKTGDRVHFAPRQILETRKVATAARRFDLVIAADFGDKATVPEALKTIESALAENAKAKIGLLACQSLLPLVLNRKVDESLVELLNQAKVEAVYPQDQVTVAHLSVLGPSAFINSQRVEDFDWRIGDFGYVSGFETWHIDRVDEERAIGDFFASLQN